MMFEFTHLSMYFVIKHPSPGVFRGLKVLANRASSREFGSAMKLNCRK